MARTTNHRNCFSRSVFAFLSLFVIHNTSVLQIVRSFQDYAISNKTYMHFNCSSMYLCATDTYLNSLLLLMQLRSTSVHIVCDNAR